MLKNVEVKSFRKLKNLILEDCGQINLILGKNNCGKTSLLEALFLIIGPTNPRLTFSIESFRDLGLTDPDDLRFIFNQLDFENTISIGATLRNNEKRQLTIKPKFIETFVPITPESIENEPSRALSTSSEYLNKPLGLDLETKVTKKSEKTNIYNAGTAFEGNIIKFQSAKNFEESIIGRFIEKTTNPRDLYEKLDDLLIDKKKYLLIQDLREIDDSIQDISLGRGDMVYIDVGFERLLPLNLLGDGMRRFLSLLTSIHHLKKNGIILVDELENGLHYTSHSIVWKSIFKTIKELNTQLFITTHSWETLEILKTILSQTEYQDVQDLVKCYSIRDLPDKTTKAYRYDFEEFEHAINQDIEMR